MPDIKAAQDLVEAIPPVAGRGGKPRRRRDTILADGSYDSRAFRDWLHSKRIASIIPQRGRKKIIGLGRIRWVVEQAIAHLHQFKRLAIRWGPTPVHARGLHQARRRAHLLATPGPAGRFWIGCQPSPSPSDLELPIDTQHPPDIHFAFGMQATRASRFLPDGLMNRNWRLDTEEGPFALKELLDIDAATARRNLAILSSLAASGLPVPAPARTTTGDLVAEIGDRAFYLLSWIEGSRIPGDALTMRQIENLGTLLGRLHLRINDAAVGLPAPESAPSTPRTVADAFGQIAHLQAIIAGQERPDPFDTLAADTFERRKELLDAHHEFVPSNRLPDVPVGWVHGDFHSSNLLWNADRVTGILDWDRLGAKPFGEEVVRAAILHFKSEDGTIDLGRVTAFTQAYRRIVPVSSDALADAEHRLWWHHLTSFWILWFHYGRADFNSDHLLGPRENLVQWWTEHRDSVRSAFTTAT